MKIIGLSAYYHDSSVALVEDGKILYAASEERFSRVKGDSRFPRLALKNLIEYMRVNPSEVSAFVFYDKPFLKFERLLETYLAFAPRGYSSFRKAMPIWINEKIFTKRLLFDEIEKCCGVTAEKKIFFSEHHLSHAASAFYPSPFEEAAILTVDGVGEWATTTIAKGVGNKIEILNELKFPHSLGLLYSAFTYYTGFKVNSGEYKVMGLAPYGKPVFADLIKEKLIEIKKDGSFRLNMKYFDFATDLTMTNRRFHKLFGGEPRKPESLLTQKEMDLAASVQFVLEEVMLKLAQKAHDVTGFNNLVMAGGVALNCVANGKILRSRIFDKIWIQPASGDAGGAIGAALAYYHLENGEKREVLKTDAMSGAYLGPSFSKGEVKSFLTNARASFEEIEDEENLINCVVGELVQGKIVGWHQGRMEFGPRALGARSILGDPRFKDMQSRMNLKIKFRESFRPFAPSVMREYASSFFDLDIESPYMLLVSQVKEKHCVKTDSDKFGIERVNEVRSTIPAVTHLDYSARIQTVDAMTNPRYHRLLKKFYEQTGVPLLVNTSFNIRGEPIACTPEESYNCFLSTDIDFLVMENFVVRDKGGSKREKRGQFDLD